jgi:hypothetical protein
VRHDLQGQALPTEAQGGGRLGVIGRERWHSAVAEFNLNS